MHGLADAFEYGLGGSVRDSQRVRDGYCECGSGFLNGLRFPEAQYVQEGFQDALGCAVLDSDGF